MIKTFVKKPIKVQAVQWTGNNYEEILKFIGHARFVYSLNSYSLVIKTLEGDHYAKRGDWIIRGINGEFYPCKPDIFDKTYKEATHD